MPKTSTSFKPGQTGNPNGRPKEEWTWSGVLRDAVEEMAKDGQPIKKHVATAILRETLKGNVQAFNAIANRMDGMPAQQTDITSKGEKLEAPHITLDIKE